MYREITRDDLSRAKFVKSPSFHHGEFMGYDLSIVLPDGFEQKIAFEIQEVFADFVIEMAEANLKTMREPEPV
jgi:hypothetical protein